MLCPGFAWAPDDAGALQQQAPPSPTLRRGFSVPPRVSAIAEPALQNSALDAALDRWKIAFEKAKATP
jgi:hypothetical protein